MRNCKEIKILLPQRQASGKVFLASAIKAAPAAGTPKVKSTPQPFHGQTARFQIAQIRITEIIAYLRR
jgi:hypothetical protein